MVFKTLRKQEKSTVLYVQKKAIPRTINHIRNFFDELVILNCVLLKRPREAKKSKEVRVHWHCLVRKYCGLILRRNRDESQVLGV